MGPKADYRRAGAGRRPFLGRETKACGADGGVRNTVALVASDRRRAVRFAGFGPCLSTPRVCHTRGGPLDSTFTVSRARFTPKVGLLAGVQGRSVAFAAFLSTLVAATSLTVVLVPRPAAADQIGDLKAQAKAISQALIQEQLQIGAYQQQYSVASTRVAADARAVAQIGSEIGQDKRRISKETNIVRQLAIVSYMDAGASLSGSDEVFTGNAENAELTNEYSAISAGNIETALDRFHAAQRVLQTHEATLEQAQVKDRADAALEATDLGQANRTEQEMESEQAQVTGHLASVVAQQAAVQAAAAAAAVVAAQKAATQAAAARIAATLGSTVVGAGVPARSRTSTPISSASSRPNRVGTTQPCRPTGSIWAPPVQPGDVEHGGPGGRPLRPGRRTSERRFRGGPGRCGHRPLHAGRSAAVAGRPLRLIPLR